MKKLRNFTWLGVGLVALASALALYSSINGSESLNYNIAWILAIFGTILVAIAGFISRPRFFWLVAIVIGIAYIASLYGWLGDNSAGFIGLIMVTMPGIVCIILGVLIKRTSGNKKK